MDRREVWTLVAQSNSLGHPTTSGSRGPSDCCPISENLQHGSGRHLGQTSRNPLPSPFFDRREPFTSMGRPPDRTGDPIRPFSDISLWHQPTYTEQAAD